MQLNKIYNEDCLQLNKIYNEDCLLGLQRIPNQSVDLIVTDPPYGINYQRHIREKVYKKMKNDNSLDFLNECFLQCNRVLKDNTAIYCFCSWHNVDVFKREFEKFFKLKNIIIWVKNNTSMGDLEGSYAPKHEMVLFGHKGRRKLEGFRYPDVLGAARTGNKLHPTQKPLDLIELLIKNSSQVGDVVLDPFLGSGSTAVACINTNRNFIGFEISKEYCDIANQRINGSVLSFGGRGCKTTTLK